MWSQNLQGLKQLLEIIKKHWLVQIWYTGGVSFAYIFALYLTAEKPNILLAGVPQVTASLLWVQGNKIFSRSSNLFCRCVAYATRPSYFVSRGGVSPNDILPKKDDWEKIYDTNTREIVTESWDTLAGTLFRDLPELREFLNIMENLAQDRWRRSPELTLLSMPIGWRNRSLRIRQRRTK